MRAYGVLIAFVAVAGIGVSAQNWPAFRGEAARGVSESGSPPRLWDVPAGSNVRWKVAIPGLSHASPVVWNGRAYVLSAVAEGSVLDRTAQGVVFAKDTVQHEWKLHCVDLSSGALRWTRTIHTGTPRQPRHVRGTYANATPATNGRVIVVSLANEGLFGLDMEGKVLWRVEMTPPKPDASLDPASSPVIIGDLAIVQNDWRQGSFAAAFDLSTGKERWRIPRSDGLSWATPGVWTPPGASPQVVFNSPAWIRAHDPASGREIWRLDNAVTSPWDRVPTPVASGSLLFVGGGGPEGPLLAVRSSATGEIRGEPGAHVAWRNTRGAFYLPTPLVREGLVYVVGDSGILTTYRARDGTQVYRQRIAADAGTISASPVAAGGRVYIASQDGDVFVVAAGEKYELLARNRVGEPIFATPAIAGDLMIVRTASHLYGLADRR